MRQTTGAESRRNAQHWRWEIPTEQGDTKTLELIHGDLCNLPTGCDVVVCSAFQRDYLPTWSSLIGALQHEKGIDVAQLSLDPELDFRSVGCWLSRETGTDYRRVACVELIRQADLFENSDQAINTILRKSFSTLRFILEVAGLSGIPIETIATPILGAGNQSIDISFIAAPLITQFRAILSANEHVRRITICEKSLEKAEELAKAISATLTESARAPQVFISYSSRQQAAATEIRSIIESQHIPCWMAPTSIPEGSSYQEMIPVALQQVDVILLLLTPDAEKSRWVQKEVGAAIGANKVILPYQMTDFPLGSSFRFLLDGEQIMYHNDALVAIAPGTAAGMKYARLVSRLKELLSVQAT